MRARSRGPTTWEVKAGVSSRPARECQPGAMAQLLGRWKAGVSSRPAGAAETHLRTTAVINSKQFPTRINFYSGDKTCTICSLIGGLIAYSAVFDKNFPSFSQWLFTNQFGDEN